MIKVLYIISDNWNEYNSSHYRVSVLADAVKKAFPDKFDYRVISITSWNKKTPHSRHLERSADIIVLQRILMNEIMPHVETLLKMGKKVVCDWDDAYDLIADENAAYPFWGEGKFTGTTKNGLKIAHKLSEHPVDQMKKNLRRISAATMPSRQLAKDWDYYVKTVAIQNYLPEYYWRDVSLIRKKVQLIGWGGSLSHLTSFSHSGVQEALRKVLNKHNDWIFLLCGDDRILKQLPFKDRVAHQHYVTWMDWPKTLSLYDIGIAPIAQPYDARRSWLKVAEYIACGIPFIATKGAPYQDLFECDSGVFIDQGEMDAIDQKNVAEWTDALDNVMSNWSVFRNRATINRELWYKKLSAKENAGKILQKFEEIMD